MRTAHRPAHAAPTRRPDLPLALSVGAHLLALLLLPRVITVDGPSHVAGAWVLAHHADEGEELLRRLYDLHVGPLPNLLATLLLAGLLHLAGPDAAERLLVAALVALLPLGLRYALRAVDPRGGWLAVLAVPFATGYLYYYGFYDFCLALALSLFVVGLALRRGQGWTVASGAGLAVLLLLTWSAHLLPLLVAGVTVAVLALERARTAWRAGVPALRALGRHVLPPALAALPVVVLTLLFLGSAAAGRGAAVRRSLPELLLGLVTSGRALVVYSRYEYVPATLLTLTIVGVALRRRSGEGSPERRALLVATLLATAAYFASPDRFGVEYGFLNDRLALFPPLLLLLRGAGPPPRDLTRRAVVALALGATVALAALRVPTEVRYQRDVAELLSVAPRLPPHSVLVGLQYWRDPPVGGQVRNPFRDPLRHEPSRVAVLADSVDLGHYEAATAYFPVRFAEPSQRRRLDPTQRGLEMLPPRVDLTAAGPDVVLVVGRNRAPAQVLAAPESVRVLGELRARYRPAGASSPSGLVEVWQRRPADVRSGS